MTLSEDLRERMKNSGLTVYMLAKLSGTSTDALYRFVKGERTLQLKTVDKLAAAMQLELTSRQETHDG